MRVCALVSDLMDRSRLSASIPDVQFALDGTADVVIIDLARDPQMVPEIRAEMPGVRIVCYGPHVDDDAAAVRPHRGRRRGHAPFPLLPRPRRRHHSPTVVS